MAVPPEPLRDLLRRATRGLVADVLEEVERGPEIGVPSGQRPPGWVGPIDPDPWQLLRIRVRDVLFGPVEPTELLVRKPENPYLLEPGTLQDRVMLLETRTREPHPIILGRYGPTYRQEDVLRELDLTDRG